MASVQQQISSVIFPITAYTDLFNGSPTGVAVNMKKWEEANLLLQLRTSGGTGQGRVEVYCCDNEAKDNPVEIDYMYRKATTDDVYGEVQKAVAGAASRIATTVGATLGDQYLVMVKKELLKEGKPWVYFKLVEVVDDPVVGIASIILTNPVEMIDGVPPLATV